MSLWKGRFRGETSDVMKHLNDSLHIDIRLFPYDTRLNAAWAEELKSVGIISDTELEAVKKALSGLSEEYLRGGYIDLPNDEDVHTLVERRLTEEIGDTGKKIHTGKSRNDQVVTDLKLYLKDLSEELNKQLKQLIGIILRLANENVGTLMPGYTHLQQAQPVSLAHYLLSFGFSLNEDLDRLNKYVETNLSACPLGSGAIAGTTIAVDRERLAKRLGFKRATENSIQSTSDRAFVIELAGILAIISMHLSRYAEDLIIWNTKEFSFIDLSDAVSTGSSMMPQKKNPDSLELIRSIPGTVYGNLVGLLTITKGAPLCYVKDLQDDKKFVFESIDITMSSLDLFCEVLNGIRFNKDRLKGTIDRDTLTTDLADILVQKKIPFRTAHQEVAALVRYTAENAKTINALTKDELSEVSKNITIDDIKSLSPETSVERRAAPGGTATSSIREQIRKLEESL